MRKLFYPLGLLILASLYFAEIQPYGFRIPVYYLPDGKVIEDSENVLSGESRIYSIDSSPPAHAWLDFPTPIDRSIEGNLGNYTVSPVAISPSDIMYDFLEIILLSFLFLLCGIWFIDTANDWHLAAFCFNITILAFTFVSAVSMHENVLLFQIASFFLVPTFLNLGLRLAGKEIPGALLLIEFIFVTIFGVAAALGNQFENMTVLLNFTYFSTLFSSLIVTLILVDNALKRSNEEIGTIKRWAPVAGIVLGLIIPTILYRTVPDINDLIFASLIALFPMALIYSAYRIHLIPFQFIASRSFVSVLLTIFLVVLYSSVLILYSFYFQATAGHFLVHIVLIFLLIFLLDPIKKSIANYAEKHIIRLDNKLTESLQRIAVQLSAPINIQSTLQNVLHEVKETLNVDNMNILAAESIFPDLELKSLKVLRIPKESQLWKYISPGHVTVTSYLTYGAGYRSDLYHFLMRHDVYMAIGIANTESGIDRFRFFQSNKNSGMALLVGKKSFGHMKTKEIGYLKEVCRLLSMLAFNYSLLLRELEKRSKMRDLLLAGQVQRNIFLPELEETAGIHFSYFNMPVISVTGDYLDILELDAENVAIFLGDVSGHGLGTGYLVSALRSIVRSHLKEGASLEETIKVANLFLLDHYQGNEFITLFSCIINKVTGKMEYINAAHPGPYIKKPRENNLIHIQNTQRLLGILPAPYRSSTMQLEPGQRIFLYSDGVIETFNQNDQAFGDALMANFIKVHGDEQPEKLPELLKNQLTEFRGSLRPGDDTTFLVVDYTGKPEEVKKAILNDWF